MPTPTTLNDTTVALTPRGRLAVQLHRLRDAIRALGPADREWAADALVVLLADCSATVPANGKGGLGSPRRSIRRPSGAARNGEGPGTSPGPLFTLLPMKKG